MRIQLADNPPTVPRPPAARVRSCLGLFGLGMLFGLGIGWGNIPLAGAEPGVDGWRSLFDGQSLDGWEGRRDWFRVEDGAIVAGSLQHPVPRNEFLSTREVFADFELELQVKLVGDGANAGVQFRTRRIANHHEVSGYQADMGESWWGKLYDESRRNRVLAGPGNEVDAATLVRANDWNTYRIRCEGPHIQLWLNGVPTVDYTETDPNIDRFGIIAVQIHSGPPSEAWYKEIRIRELP